MCVKLKITREPTTFTVGKPITRRSYDPSKVTITFKNAKLQGYVDKAWVFDTETFDVSK